VLQSRYADKAFIVSYSCCTNTNTVTYWSFLSLIAESASNKYIMYVKYSSKTDASWLAPLITETITVNLRRWRLLDLSDNLLERGLIARGGELKGLLC